MVAVSLVLYIVDDLSSTQPPIQSLSCLHPKCFFSSTYNRLSGLFFFYYYYYFGLCVGWMTPLYNYLWFISYSWGLIWRLLTTPAIASTLYRTQPFSQMVINDDLLALTCIMNWIFFFWFFFKFYCSLLYYSFYRAIHAIFVWTHTQKKNRAKYNGDDKQKQNKSIRKQVEFWGHLFLFKIDWTCPI
jgi:hypothetical protein